MQQEAKDDGARLKELIDNYDSISTESKEKEAEWKRPSTEAPVKPDPVSRFTMLSELTKRAFINFLRWEQSVFINPLVFNDMVFSGNQWRQKFSSFKSVLCRVRLQSPYSITTHHRTVFLALLTGWLFWQVE
jgi:hypothetical protein